MININLNDTSINHYVKHIPNFMMNIDLRKSLGHQLPFIGDLLCSSTSSFLRDTGGAIRVLVKREAVTRKSYKKDFSNYSHPIMEYFN